MSEDSFQELCGDLLGRHELSQSLYADAKRLMDQTHMFAAEPWYVEIVE